MRKPLLSEVLENLKSTLRDLENVRMTSQDDPALCELKRDLRERIKSVEAALE